MTPEECEAQRAKFQADLVALLETYREAIAPDVEMPIISDWVIVVAVDSVADALQGRIAWSHAPSQWLHRTLGIMQVAGSMMMSNHAHGHD